MTDSHCHVSGGDPSVRELLIGRDFVGVHPWEAAELGPEDVRRKAEDLVSCLTSSVSRPLPLIGVGEIGLDRLRQRDISPRMREMFEAQLRIALEFRRPVVLHGAKCWGQVVREVEKVKLKMENARTARPDRSQFSIFNSKFLFHGFSRSDGLIPDIVALGGYISVGPAVLNDHAVNYRELVKKIPLDRLLLETDRTEANAASCPSVREVAAKVAELRGLSPAELEALTDRNANDFLSAVPDSLAFARSARDERIEAVGAEEGKRGTVGAEEGTGGGMDGADCVSGVGGDGQMLSGECACAEMEASERTERANASESDQRA